MTHLQGQRIEATLGQLAGVVQEALDVRTELANPQSAYRAERAEQDRLYEDHRPVLEGRVVPWPGHSDERDHRLEIHLKSRWPMVLITLDVPGMLGSAPHAIHRQYGCLS